MGAGRPTATIAGIRQLGLDTLLLSSADDFAVFKPAADALGEQFLFVAMPVQVYDSLPDGPLKQEIGRFLAPWRDKYGDRDPALPAGHGMR